jgi:tRNA nucleotidyltransferase (CCA-adding enzyme)
MFLKKLGIYGAEIYTKGFSGYLCELLILYYGGFINLIKNVASNWKPPIVIDIEKAYGDSYNDVIKVFNAPLIVIDPVDKGRNVAAVVSLKTLTKFISACKALLDNPKLSFFDPDYAITPKRVSLPQDIHILGIKITHKAEIPDILFSQVEKIKNKIKKHLQKNNFEVLKEVVFSNFIDTSLIIFLLPSLSIPKVYVRQGPYPYFPEEKKFIDKNREKFIWIDDDGRWKVLEIRQITDVRMLVSQILNYIKIPDLLRNANFNIMIDDELFNDKTISKWLKKLEYREDFWVDIR